MSMRQALINTNTTKKTIILTLLISNLLILISSKPKYYINNQTSKTQTGIYYITVGNQYYTLCGHKHLHVHALHVYTNIKEIYYYKFTDSCRGIFK